MPNRSIDSVFHLVKALKKEEKRHFKLYFKRSGTQGEFKLVQLFDALDKMETYDEELLLKRTKSISKKQLSNTKAYLAKQILTSLRQLRSEAYYDIKLRQEMDHARLLYNKGLYLESLKSLASIKEEARSIHQHAFVLQILDFEKHIEYLHITRSFEERAECLSNESLQVQKEIGECQALSNLSLRLYSWYIRRGHARNEDDVKDITVFLHNELDPHLRQSPGFYQRLHVDQSLCWYAFIVQDLLLYYRHAQKWVDLFAEEPAMQAVEIMHYTKGMHNLLNAHFMLRNVVKYDELLDEYSHFIQKMEHFHHDNAVIQSLVYYYIARLNQYFMKGHFTEGLSIVPELERQVEKNKIHLDGHRILVFYYKIACLYFGSGNKEKAIDYLNKIINWKTDLRTDLQCYARLLHLLAHYDLGNMDLAEHLVISVYRFMAKMKNLSGVEEEIFKFLRRAVYFREDEIIAGFQDLRAALKQFEGNPLMARSFMYLDLISWLESKIEKRPVELIIQEKFEREFRHRNNKLAARAIS